MRVVGVLDDAVLILLDNETASCHTVHGIVEVKAGTGVRRILAVVRTDGKGRTWLGAWRPLGRREPEGTIRLSTDTVYSDRLCRRVAASGDCRVLRVSSLFGGVPLFPDETLISGKGMPLYVMPMEWSRHRGFDKAKGNKYVPGKHQ